MSDVLNWKQILKNHKLFRELDGHEIDALLGPSKSSELVKEAHIDPVIFRQGDIGDSIYLIGEGEALVVLTKHDNTTFTVATLGKGDLFGEMAFFEQRPRSATIIAKVADNRCILREFRAQPFKAFLASHPNLEFKLTALLSERLRKVTEGILQVQLQDIDDRFTLLNSKVESEFKISDNAVKTAQTMFDATNQRVNELSARAAAVIDAEKSRQATLSKIITWGTPVIGAVIAVLGFFGWKTVEDVVKKHNEISAMYDTTRQAADSIIDTRREIESYRELMLPLYLRYVAIDDIFFYLLSNPQEEQSARQLDNIFLQVMKLDSQQEKEDPRAQFSVGTKNEFLNRIFTEIVTDRKHLRKPLQNLLKRNVQKVAYKDRPLIYYFIWVDYKLIGQEIDDKTLKNMKEDLERSPGYEIPLPFRPEKMTDGLTGYYYQKIREAEEAKKQSEENKATDQEKKAGEIAVDKAEQLAKDDVKKLVDLWEKLDRH